LAATAESEKPVEKPAKKPMMSSATKSIDDEKKSCDDSNKEKAPKRKPIVFDLEISEKEVNPIDIIKPNHVPVNPKQNTYVVRRIF
jgi:hypothetical protein